MYGISREGSTFNQVAGDQYTLYLPPPPLPANCTLPAVTAAFTGREKQVQDIIAAATTVAEGRRGVAIHAIDGMPGVGKTALAVQVGHLLVDLFPDKQLFLDLHGHSAGHDPIKPGVALAHLLAADGVDARYLPQDLNRRSAMWRDRIAGKRIVLILDNAASSDQIAPLLPGTAGCLVLITSRRYLGDLTPAVAEVPLTVLPSEEAARMFLQLAPRATATPDKVIELVDLCGHLPLAISLLASVYTMHQSWEMDELIQETKEKLLTAAAESRTVDTAFSLSYKDLTSAEQLCFRRVGLHPGGEFDRNAAAALTDLPAAAAASLLDRLHSYRLLTEPTYRRYRMHDLIRNYARTLHGPGKFGVCPIRPPLIS
jgi:hypothetical protein